MGLVEGDDNKRIPAHFGARKCSFPPKLSNTVTLHISQTQLYVWTSFVDT